MKKGKSPNSPPTVPQMTLFETEPAQPAPAADLAELPVKQPEPATKSPPIPSAPVRKKPAPAQGSKPAPKTGPTAAQRKTTPATQQRAPRPAKGGGSSAVPEGDVRLTANIRQDLHLKLKIAAARQRTTIGELIEQWVENSL